MPRPLMSNKILLHTGDETQSKGFRRANAMTSCSLSPSGVPEAREVQTAWEGLVGKALRKSPCGQARPMEDPSPPPTRLKV